MTFYSSLKIWMENHGPPATRKERPRLCTNLSLFLLPLAVTRASREGSEDPGWGGHVSDRKKSPGAFAEEELLQWRPSLFHGDSAKCDGHLQKSNLHPSSRRRAGKTPRLRKPPEDNMHPGGCMYDVICMKGCYVFLFIQSFGWHYFLFRVIFVSMPVLLHLNTFCCCCCV